MKPQLCWPYILVSIAAFAAFAGIASQIEQDNGLTQSDRQLAEDLRAHAKETPMLVTTSHVFSFIGSWRVLVPLGLLVAALLLYQKRYTTVVIWVVALALGPLMNTLIKHAIRRPRPFATPEDDWSFPSGHSMNSFIYFGLLTYMLFVLVPQRWLKLAAAFSLLILVVLIGGSRMYLTRHYLSDVLGGFSFGAGWVAAWIAVFEFTRRRQPAPVESV